ncbi:MAG: GLPGLI family protein [Ginsengibacter sp.]|jgi:GLPGLI family protein
MQKIFTIIGSFFILNSCYSQTIFIQKAKIEFERKVNAWASISGDYADQLKKSIPQYRIDHFNYESDGNKSIYKLNEESASKAQFGYPANDNIVFSDYNSNKYIAQKNVFEKSFLIEDSLRKATWKFTNDFREIAGFNCRRATTMIMDSIFVVAFFTDEIMIPGGPESFNGLPGMILGLVINRLHTTWYATKVELDINAKNIVPPAKGKKINIKELNETLKNSFSNWGKGAEKNIWSIMI